MSYEIKKVAVLGTGVMGAQIAAHFTNAKIPVLAYDMSQKIAEDGINSICPEEEPAPLIVTLLPVLE